MRLFVLAAMLCMAARVPVSAAEPHLASPLERFSYGVGLQIGQSLTSQGINKLDPAALALAIQDMLNGQPPRLTMEQLREAQTSYRKALLDERKAVSDKNLADGESFLAANAKRDGIVSLESGVQYRVLKEGEGTSPNIDDTVKVHYRGTLLDGREFDSSLQRGEPLTIPLNGVISGWQQVVSRMKPGGTVETWIPAKHAYGERGSPPAIGPNSTLYFHIQLLGIESE